MNKLSPVLVPILCFLIRSGMRRFARVSCLSRLPESAVRSRRSRKPSGPFSVCSASFQLAVVVSRRHLQLVVMAPPSRWVFNSPSSVRPGGLPACRCCLCASAGWCSARCRCLSVVAGFRLAVVVRLSRRSFSLPSLSVFLGELSVRRRRPSVSAGFAARRHCPCAPVSLALVVVCRPSVYR